MSEEYLRKLNPQGRLHVYGQEVNAETYATCRADMLIKGQDASRIRFGNSFDNDQHHGERFDYLLANPPFGVEWKMVADAIRGEHKTRGFAGQFGAGLPRINDGSFLFLQHMISKMKRPDEGGARLAIVLTALPCSLGRQGRESLRFGGGSSRTTGSKLSSPIPTSCSTTPGSRPTSGWSPTANLRSGVARWGNSVFKIGMFSMGGLGRRQ